MNDWRRQWCANDSFVVTCTVRTALYVFCATLRQRTGVRCFVSNGCISRSWDYFLHSSFQRCNEGRPDRQRPIARSYRRGAPRRVGSPGRTCDCWRGVPSVASTSHALVRVRRGRRRRTTASGIATPSLCRPGRADRRRCRKGAGPSGENDRRSAASDAAVPSRRPRGARGRARVECRPNRHGKTASAGADRCAPAGLRSTLANGDRDAADPLCGSKTGVGTYSWCE